VKAVGDLITFQSELMVKDGEAADGLAEGGQRLILGDVPTIVASLSRWS